MNSLHRNLCCAATLLALALPAAASTDDPARLWREQALAHEHGSGVARDIGVALDLYCKAALAGDAQALYRMGWIYTNGRGVARNDAFAAYLFQQAAGLGDEVSRNMLRLVGSQTAKPPCIVQAEAEVAQRQAELQAAAQAAEAAAAAKAAHEVATNRYKTLIDTAQKKQIMAIVQRLAPQYGVHPGLAYAVIRAESNFDPQAVSPKNAQGLMQLIPETAARFKVIQPLDPEQNIRGGLAYLRWLLAYFKGDVQLAVAAYNAGEGAVERFKGIPPYPETQGYVRRIQEVFNLPHHPFDARVSAPSPVLPRIASRPQS
ncbi:MAG: lytic transglycosylase [Comamonadaceae bacterium]|nr:lytic transglycosylase [Comamonadaceae bacterium]